MQTNALILSVEKHKESVIFVGENRPQYLRRTISVVQQRDEVHGCYGPHFGIDRREFAPMRRDAGR